MLYNNDDFIDAFERRLCEYTAAPYAVAVDRCTNAILLALKAIQWSAPLHIPTHTYLSVPMTLMHHSFDITFEAVEWVGEYNLRPSPVYDCAVGFNRDMYKPGTLQCLSFQQKKRLAIGKGGAILLDDPVLYDLLKRMRHDGRNSRIPVRDEILQGGASDIIMGYHMNMSPDEAAKGILLLNQLGPALNGNWCDYPDISTLPCFASSH
jgi:dTDP-4-amino-4,6-dideoxygalactose transaminase